MPASVTNIGQYAFSDCRGLTAFSVDEANPKYKSVSKLLLTKDGKTLVYGVNGLGHRDLCHFPSHIHHPQLPQMEQKASAGASLRLLFACLVQFLFQLIRPCQCINIIGFIYEVT